MDGGLGSGVREDGDVVLSEEVCGEGGGEAEGGVRGVMEGEILSRWKVYIAGQRWFGCWDVIIFGVDMLYVRVVLY